jgi:hypothetical protein
MVGMRLAFFDYGMFFKTRYIPNHDMYQGASLFATSMDSIRLEGDLAWWNPISQNGYAQYYQTFLSPLAPTSNHIVFIVWSQLIQLLNLAGIALPEYIQYLTVNYIILPFLNFLAFSLFTTILFRRRATIFLVVVAYVFSGIGIWDSAWFYFQEGFSLFFLLWSIFKLLRQPTIPNWLIFLAAALLQITSLNYWTIYNSWFVLILLGAYAWTHPNQFHRLGRRTWQLFKHFKLKVLVVVGLVGLVTALWLLIIVSTALEQSSNYIRNSTAGNIEAYNALDALAYTKELRTYTSELFNPTIYRSLKFYKFAPPAHEARYIGLFLLPLLILLVCYKWRRKERWLVSSAVGVLVVCLVPPFMLDAWTLTPFMNRIVHTFYFYSHYWQLLLVLLAGVSFERLLDGYHKPNVQKLFRYILGSFAALSALIILGFNLFAQNFGTGDLGLEAGLYIGLLGLLGSILLLQLLVTRTKRNRYLLIGLFLFLFLTDCTRYFWQVNQEDHKFTVSRSDFSMLSDPLPDKVQQALRKPWSAPNTNMGFNAGLFDNMPFKNSFWPQNAYLIHKYLFDLGKTSQDFLINTLSGPALQFYDKAQAAPAPADYKTFFDKKNITGLLVLNMSPDVPVLASPIPNQAANGTSFSYQWLTWNYNDFSYEVNAPKDGWLLINQLYDPAWHLSLDGKPAQLNRANFVGMAVPIAVGKHTLAISYWPLARRLYWPAGILLEACLLCLLLLFFRVAKDKRRLREKSKTTIQKIKKAPDLFVNDFIS